MLDCRRRGIVVFRGAAAITTSAYALAAALLIGREMAHRKSLVEVQRNMEIGLERQGYIISIYFVDKLGTNAS